MRKAVLEERFPGTSNAKAVEGTLLHDLLQAALAEQLSSQDALQERAEKLVAANVEQLLQACANTEWRQVQNPDKWQSTSF